jgi:hypothetical protein
MSVPERLSDEAIIAKLDEMRRLYNGEADGVEWPLDELRCDLEEIFLELKQRK